MADGVPGARREVEGERGVIRAKSNDTAAALLRAWTETHRLWLASRQGVMPHQIAGQLAAAHAVMDRAVSEAERAGVVVVERDSGGRVTAIRPAAEPKP